MKRLAIKLVLFLLLGAIVNVAVAWGVALWSPTARLPGYLYSREMPSLFSRAAPSDWPRHTAAAPYVGMRFYGCTTGIGLRSVSLRVSDFSEERNPYRVMTLCHAGWPQISMQSIGVAEGLNRPSAVSSQLEWRHAVNAPAFMRPRGSLFYGEPWPLPLRPIWPGFAINTIFYAAALWVIFAIPGSVKRLRRRINGWCIHCGYDLRAKPPDSDKCPECGRNAPANRGISRT
jgi:hypothetical protein